MIMNRRRKVVPLITDESLFRQHVRELVFGVNTFGPGLWESKLILSNDQSSATLWVLDTCLIVGPSAFDDHFDRCFVIFKDVQLRLALRRMCVCGYMIHITQLPSFDIQGLGFGIQSRFSFLDASMFGLDSIVVET